jgi:hypothetical protein
MDAVEPRGGVAAVEIDNALDVAKKSFAMLAGFIGFGAGEQGFDANVGAMEERLGELVGVLRRTRCVRRWRRKFR